MRGTPPLRALVTLLPLLVAAVAPLRATGAGAAPYPPAANGFDVSWPQCGGAFPTPPFAFAIVGVNHSVPYTDNQCLSAEFAWARQATAVPPSLYMSIDNPTARTATDASAYGAGAADDAVAHAQAAGAVAATWWVDVETSDAWSADTSLNALVIQGALDALRGHGVTPGVYSTSYQWGVIAGTYKPGVPIWVAGAADEQDAPAHCGPSSAFAGGVAAVVQYPNGPFDGDYGCAGSAQGYWLAASDGGVFAFGNARYLGGMGGTLLNAPVVAMAATPSGRGYWLVASDGGVFAFGDATFLGSMGGRRLNAPVVGMAATRDGGGYWLVASDGGVFAFGDAPFAGSMGGTTLNAPVVAIAADGAGSGYRIVASDGGVFCFGGATFRGGTGGMTLNAPVTGMAVAAADGYWLVASDGGVFTFGGADFFGSTAARRFTAPTAGMAATPDGGGYWLVRRDGGVSPLGDAVGFGSMAGRSLAAPVVGTAAWRPPS